jgi:glycosyltransferase involved in cell wall biosynthesis
VPAPDAGRGLIDRPDGRLVPEEAPCADAAPRVIYVCMKAQARGRLRRNLRTLLDLGADVTVLTVPSRQDFFVGLQHPRLRAEFLPARSVYMRLAELTSSAARLRRRALREQRRRNARPSRLTMSLAGAALLARRLLLELLAAFSHGGRAIAKLAQRAWHGVGLPVRAAAWRTARWLVRWRRRATRAWERQVEQPVRGALAICLRTVGRHSTLDRPNWRSHRVARRLRRRRLRHRRRTLRRQSLLRLRRRASRRAAQLRQAVHRIVVTELKRALRPWHRVNRFLAFWGESARRVAELEPDLIASSDLPGLVGAGRAAKRLGVPHFHDCHELYLESSSFRASERAVLQPFERRWLRSADSVIAVNESIAQEYGRRYSRVPVVVRNCVPRPHPDLVPVDIRGVIGLSGSARIVLYQGGFTAGRGLDVCVTSAIDLPADTHLVMLGYGPLSGTLAALADRLQVTDRVHLLDAVPPEELGAWTAAADVGLVPYQPVSHNNRLALPNKVFEYTAVGVPVVTSDLPELRRIAIDEDCGEVYDPFDPLSLARAIGEVLEPLRYDRHRAAARAFGRHNVWETEREILVRELARLCPAFATAHNSEEVRVLDEAV